MTTSATGGTTDGLVGTQRRSHRAAVLRPRRLVGRDREIAEVIESVALKLWSIAVDVYERSR